MVRFYTVTAPGWWPYQLVSLGNRRLPPRRYGFYYILVDNGMFKYYSKVGERPPLHRWFAELKRFVWDVERLRRPKEIIVILPDWLYDFPFTYEAARSVYARELCSSYKCLVVAHPGADLGAYAAYAERYAAIDWVWGLAAPLKINCSKYSARAGRRIVNLSCQAAIVEQVCSVAKRYGLKCHGLGVALKPEHVARLVRLGLTSFDSSSWTRPNNSVVAHTAPWSAKTKEEKERFFRLVLDRLREAGIELEGVEEVVAE